MTLEEVCGILSKAPRSIFRGSNAKKLKLLITECEARSYLTNIVLSNDRLKSDLQPIEEDDSDQEKDHDILKHDYELQKSNKQIKINTGPGPNFKAKTRDKDRASQPARIFLNLETDETISDEHEPVNVKKMISAEK